MVLLGLVAVARAGEAFPPLEGRTNLASGKPVEFSPRPNYAPTARGETDATDLTDGRTVARADQSLWFDAKSVGWTYPGRVNLAVDLGTLCDIDEVAVRLQGGSTSHGGLHFPGWVEVFVSIDGVQYAKLAEFSRWNPGAFEIFGIGQKRGRSVVECLRFQGLKAQARFVGLRLYGNDLMIADELYAFGKPASASASASKPEPNPAPSGFSVKHPQIYFHKPYLELATNVALPVPVGMVAPLGASKDAKVKLVLDLPAGLELLGETVGEPEPSAERGWTRRVFEDLRAADGDDPGRGKDLLRLYPRATGWKDGQRGELRYAFESEGWSSGRLTIPVRAVAIPATPRPRQIMATMGWWDATRMGWPEERQAFRTLGLNTFGVFAKWMPKERDHPRWAMLEEARGEGFFIANIDSPMHNIESQHKSEKEIYDQFADGGVGKRLCISYRGRFYHEEIQRFADAMAAVRPDFSSVDIELWTWTGPVDAKKCLRCQEDFKKSGLESWESWQKAKGKEIIGDLMTAGQEAAKQAGGKPFRSGAYDFRPGQAYQSVFEFDALYPELLQNGEVSTYTSLQPEDIILIGDAARKDRSQLPRSDLTPWNTPGDAGTFPGEAFQWSLLENFCNGARGVWFWSSRMWDSEDLIAFNRVIRAIAPVEDVIVEGELVGDAAAVVGPGRVSGMKRDGRMVLLVADYLAETEGAIRLSLNSSASATLHDLLSGKDTGIRISAGEQILTILLQEHRARLLEVRPR